MHKKPVRRLAHAPCDPQMLDGNVRLLSATRTMQWSKAKNGLKLSMIIIHQIFFARAIGLDTSRDAAKTGEYQMIFPSFLTLRFTFARLAFIPSKLLK